MLPECREEIMLHKYLTKDKYKYKVLALGDALINYEEVLIPIKNTGHSLEWNAVL